MPLADLHSVIDYNDLEYKVAEKAFKKIAQAENLIRKWIGDSKYEEIRDDTHEHYSKLKEAESLLCFALALPRLNMNLREKGGMVTATGWNETRIQLAGRRRINAEQRTIYNEARQLLRELLLPSYTIRRPENLDYRYYGGS